jgi:hypothetical protein
MDFEWGAQPLQEFVKMISLRVEISELDSSVRTLDPAVQIVMAALIRRYLGLLTLGAEAKHRMQPGAPELAADRFHAEGRFPAQS